jgi:hypothetical protein
MVGDGGQVLVGDGANLSQSRSRAETLDNEWGWEG